MGTTCHLQTRTLLSALPCPRQAGGGLTRKARERDQSLSNTFIFWLSIYLFIFNFFERMSWTARASRESRHLSFGCGKGTRPGAAFPPQTQVDLGMCRTRGSEATVPLQRKHKGPRPAPLGRLSRLSRLSSPASATFLPPPSLPVQFRFPSWWAFFCLPSSTVDFLVRG